MRRRLRRKFARFLGQESSACSNAIPKGLLLWNSRVVAQSTQPAWDRPWNSNNFVRFSLQTAIFEVLSCFFDKHWQTYLVGGTLRDLMLESPRMARQFIFPRDIDLIVCAPSIDELERAVPKELVQRRTSFGGLHLVKHLQSRCELHFDVWPLSETWAFKQFGIEASIARFPSTPFLNLDSVAIELFHEQGATRRIYEQGFFTGLDARLVDINFEPNPFPDVCAIRSLVIAAKSGFHLSRRLAEFIISRREEPALLRRWRQAQLAHYGQIRCREDELTKWLDAIEHQLSAGAERINLPVSNARQLKLWIDHPPQEFDAKPGNISDGKSGQSGTYWRSRLIS
jgi:hypothetical protein